MKNLKVSMKLIVSFFIVIFLAIVVGVIGIVGMNMISDADMELYDGNYLPTVMAGNISELAITQRTIVRNFVIYDINKDATVFKKAESDMEDAKRTMQELFDEYDPTIVNDEDRRTFDELVKVYNNEWLPILTNVHSLGVANRQEEAKTAMTEGGSVADKMSELTSKLQEINMSDGQGTVDDNQQLAFTMTIFAIVFLAVSVVIALLLVVYISSLISKPLALLTSFMNRAGTSGDISLSQEESEAVRQYAQIKDEVGQCIGSTYKFVNRLHDVGEALKTVSDGDLTKELNLLSENDTMGVSLQRMVGNLNNMFAEINSSTAQVSTGSKQIADGAQSLAQGSTEQASAVQELSSSIAEIALKTKTNADMASTAANLANTIKGNAEKGSRQMDEMMSAVKEINQASQSINKVIKVIDDIAFQTNILALNAAVEAARAGQHGKGFAVVAEEVRSLAAKSAEAAKDTGGLIANSMEKAELGARIADETAASLSEIVTGINESSQIVSEIARSSEEQSEGISQINKGIDQVAQVIQQNSATAEQSAAASEEMSGQADMLESLVSQFKLKDNGIQKFNNLRAPQRQAAIPERTVSHSSGSNNDYGKY